MSVSEESDRALFVVKTGVLTMIHRVAVAFEFGNVGVNDNFAVDRNLDLGSVDMKKKLNV